MQNALMSAYVIIIHCRAPATLGVGALGPVCFPAGWYAYVGSARRHLHARIRRHRRRQKKVRWHIDYLLARPEFVVVQVWIAPQLKECQLAQLLLNRPGVAVPCQGMGASDCRCPAHFLGYEGDITSFIRMLQELGLMAYLAPPRGVDEKA